MANLRQILLPLAIFGSSLLLQYLSPMMGVPKEMVSTVLEIVFWIWLAIRLTKLQESRLRFYYIVFFGFALGDLTCGLSQTSLRIPDGSPFTTLVYFLPYFVPTSALLYGLWNLCKRQKEGKTLLIFSHILSLCLMVFSTFLIVIPSFQNQAPPGTMIVGILTAGFSVLESWTIGISAMLLVVSTNLIAQFFLFGILAMHISDLVLRFHTVHVGVVGTPIFENSWLFGLTLLTIGMELLINKPKRDLKKALTEVMPLFSIRAMTIGSLLIGLTFTWLGVGVYYQSLLVPERASASLLIVLSIYSFAIIAANLVNRSLSRISIKLENQQPVLRNEFPKLLPQEIRTIVKYFQKLNQQLSTERDHALDLSSQLAHDIKAPTSALETVKARIERHLSDGCTCCSSLEEQLQLIGISRDAILSMTASLLKEQDRLLKLETLESSLKSAISIVQANYPQITLWPQMDSQAMKLSVIGLSRVLTNLLNNAAEASKDGQSVMITAQCNGSTLKITIQDDGSGIPEEILNEIKNGNLVTTKANGHGIGLTSTMDWASNYGYKVDISSSTSGPSPGTVVVLRIPLQGQHKRRRSPIKKRGKLLKKVKTESRLEASIS